jgi:hypothetical protein
VGKAVDFDHVVLLEVLVPETLVKRVIGLMFGAVVVITRLVCEWIGKMKRLTGK